jgi:ribosomal protein L37AE/L43A
MQDAEQLTVKRTATGYWAVQSGSEQISGAVTRQAAEAERELMRRLRRRTADMRSASPRRPRVVERLPR